jgi:hypothetical protein
LSIYPDPAERIISGLANEGRHPTAQEFDELYQRIAAFIERRASKKRLVVIMADTHGSQGCIPPELMIMAACHDKRPGKIALVIEGDKETIGTSEKITFSTAHHTIAAARRMGIDVIPAQEGAIRPGEEIDVNAMAQTATQMLKMHETVIIQAGGSHLEELRKQLAQEAPVAVNPSWVDEGKLKVAEKVFPKDVAAFRQAIRDPTVFQAALPHDARYYDIDPFEIVKQTWLAVQRSTRRAR